MKSQIAEWRRWDQWWRIERCFVGFGYQLSHAGLDDRASPRGHHFNFGRAQVNPHYAVALMGKHAAETEPTYPSPKMLIDELTLYSSRKFQFKELCIQYDIDLLRSSR